MSAPVAPGDVLGGKYRVDRVLGIGGMGVVVAATHLQLDQRVALKFMLPEAFAAPEAMTRFKREARAAVRLRSEHVARVLDVGTFDTGSPYIVMEFLEGTDLAQELQRNGPMPPQVAAEYLLQACEAIAEAHSLGIVHRDLKPANLFLTRRPDGSPLVKVLDFGISKANSLADSGGLHMTKTNAILGSPLYMSPEQMKSSRSVDARSDVWSLGVILYELLGGRVPFVAETLGELMATVMTEPHPPLVSLRADAPPALAALVDRCLVKDRDRRCASVAEIATGVAPFCPPRVLPIVERITTMLRASMPSAPSAVVSTGPAAATAQPVAAPVQTAPGWGATGGSPKGSSGARVAVLSTVAGVVLLGAIALVAVFEVRGRSRAATSSAPVATASASAASVAPAAPNASVAPVDSSAAAIASAASASAASVASANATATPTATATATQGAEPSVTAPGRSTPGRGRPTPTPAGTAKPTATPAATAAPTPTTTAAPAATPAPQKPGMLDTSY